jgi:hypothetical protein
MHHPSLATSINHHNLYLLTSAMMLSTFSIVTKAVASLFMLALAVTTHVVKRMRPCSKHALKNIISVSLLLLLLVMLRPSTKVTTNFDFNIIEGAVVDEA